MMGFPLNTLDVPMMKGSNGIIAIDTDETKEQPCIKCGRCVDVCPMELSPLYLSLIHISGVSKAIAKNIVVYREENGRFTSRKDLLKVAKLSLIHISSWAFRRFP